MRLAEVSPGPSRGQWGPRYAIHAGRHLTDKEFRYLKRVIVTPAVYRCFTRLYPGFTYRHWAGVGPSTNPFGLAGTCVFTKQSGPLVTATCGLHTRRHPFSRSYGANLPSSLGWVSPTRLRLLTQGHQCRFSVRSRWIVPEGLFTGPRDRRNPPYGRPFALSPGSRHYGTPRAYTLSRPCGPVRLPRGVTPRACVAAPTTAVREYKPVSLSPTPSYGSG